MQRQEDQLIYLAVKIQEAICLSVSIPKGTESKSSTRKYLTRQLQTLMTNHVVQIYSTEESYK